MTGHSDEELKLIKRRSAENWLVTNSKWLRKLRKGTQSSAIRGDRPVGSMRKRLEAGVNYGVLERSGTHSACRWLLTPYAEMLLEEMGRDIPRGKVKED